MAHGEAERRHQPYPGADDDGTEGEADGSERCDGQAQPDPSCHKPSDETMVSPEASDVERSAGPWLNGRSGARQQGHQDP